MSNVFNYLATFPLAACIAFAPPEPPPPQSVIQDGPYVAWKGNMATVWTLEGGAWRKKQLETPVIFSVPGNPKLTLTLSSKRPRTAPQRIPEPKRFVALSDIHGQLRTSLELLETHGVIDKDGQWTFGKGHLMILGDLADRGPEVTEGYWYFRALEAQARKAGGNVHLLLGNHEAMILGQDLRYLHPKYVASPQGGPAFEDQYGPDSELGRWLRTRNVMLKAGRFLFMHAGISNSFIEHRFSLESSNRFFHELKRWKTKGEDTHAATSFWLGASGPLWYRGLILDDHHALSPEQLDHARRLLGVQHFVVGHTRVETIRSFRGGSVIGIDAGIQDQQGELLIWERQKLFRGLKSGAKVPLQ